jgi:hypothetical protein
MFLANSSCLDICFAVNQAARHIQDPTLAHWKDVIRILQYLRGSLSKGRVFNPTIRFNEDTRTTKENLPIIAYSDANWGGKDSASSTFGIYIELASCLIIWKSSKQKCISLSTLEAEYVAALLVCREIMWIQNLLLELGFRDGWAPSATLNNPSDHDLFSSAEPSADPDLNPHNSTSYDPVTLNVNNQGAIFLANNATVSQKSKHITIQYHYSVRKMNTLQPTTVVPKI